jgi:arylsulfatase A-like enzyme
MNSNRVFVLVAALAELSTGALTAQNESLASKVTNASAAPVRHPAIPRRSSIIFIACHGLALGDLSCYGQTNFQTPNFDRLAAEGTRFTNYRAGGDGLAAAQAAMMAGSNAAFAPDQATLAARLQQAGYHTGLIGDWLLGPKPWTQGFDEFAGFLSEQEADDYYSNFIWRHLRGTTYDPTSHTLPFRDVRETIYDNADGKKNEYLPDLLLSAAANFVGANPPGIANHYQPFFLLVNLPAPHSLTPGKDDYPVPTDAPFTGEIWPQAAKNRAALVTRLDAGVGRLLEALAKVKMTNNVAIFLAGAAAPEKFADTNLSFLQLKDEVRGGDSEARLRVPMIVRWPGRVPAGRISRAPWSAPDFAPTALEIGYAQPAADVTGISILPVLLGKPGTNAPGAPQRP